MSAVHAFVMMLSDCLESRRQQTASLTEVQDILRPHPNATSGPTHFHPLSVERNCGHVYPDQEEVPARAQLCGVRSFVSLTCMPQNVPEDLSRTIETLYRSESGRILATLTRLLGDLDVAEEAMHEAFAAALDAWPQSGVPQKPRPWLISTARFKAIDGMRRRARFDSAQSDLALYLEARISDAPDEDDEIEDDRLRLIFTCCHPALPPEAQVALTLREVCGLTTEEIARAFLVTPATLAQRIVRAKAVIRDKAIPYQVPSPQELPERRASGHLSRL